MAAEEFQQDAAKATHLVVLIHGLWGNPVHLKHLRDTLATQRDGEGLYILCPRSNRDNYTYDGIEVGAERITNEIQETIIELKGKGAQLSKISVNGYSLGGLVARYVVGLLYKNAIFETLKPMNFATFATPHLGVRTPRNGYRAQTWNFLGSRTLSTSGQQMFLTDNFRETGRPLLAVMADPNSIFVRGLSMFQQRSVYANTINDRSVPFYTSGISAVDPYVDMDKVKVHPLPDQELPVVLDPSEPVTVRSGPVIKAPETWQERYLLSQKTRESLPFYAFLFTMVPIMIPLFMVNAGVQTYRSAQRVRLHEQGQLIDLKRYRIPLLEDAQAAQDRIMERLATERTHLAEESPSGYLPTPPPEPNTSSSANSSSWTLVGTTASEKQKEEQKSNKSSWPTLALTDDQFEMIDNLDKHVNFTKYPVHIQKVRHTHAAIVVRTASESFKEGHVVSTHWAKNFAD
ncbi:hypothetical protein LTR78_006705 [Recurvomyces mirabilis]|uniref:DUF676 domain-containing protein n=1 Tax=Recurvomyces mirabilis TaxID=574656 RepID=A0AAE0WKM7_9PEZI|nr:hypothetical protein LTR78_006705 [Recurvomyces mirabilis]KAK5151406.1 hypothetical protein LTS14_009249 [Recurvomyces mirabilis]